MSGIHEPAPREGPAEGLARRPLSWLEARATGALRALADGLERLSLELSPDAALPDAALPDAAPAAVDRVAVHLLVASRTLRNARPAELARAVDDAARRHPYRALAAGVALGWISGRLLRRRLSRARSRG